uniref:Uncharacterized protein n=1 Tax=Arundo donax TaxID=35708 RepID=A0A0A8XR00_ARUDO
MIKLAESHSTSEECRKFGHVSKNCPEDAKMLSTLRIKGGSLNISDKEVISPLGLLCKRLYLYVFNAKNSFKPKKKINKENQVKFLGD